MLRNCMATSGAPTKSSIDASDRRFVEAGNAERHQKIVSEKFTASTRILSNALRFLDLLFGMKIAIV
jgi:hypothetical protein